MTDQDPHHLLRKRLSWRATHRGIKEMDLLIGGFAATRLPTMELHDLVTFEQILEIPDQDLLAWVTRTSAVPENLTSALLSDILSYRPDTES